MANAFMKEFDDESVTWVQKPVKPVTSEIDKTGLVPKAKLSRYWKETFNNEEKLLATFLIKSSIYTHKYSFAAISPFFKATESLYQIFDLTNNHWRDIIHHDSGSVNDQICNIVWNEDINTYNLLNELAKIDNIKGLASVKEYGEFAYKFEEKIKELPEDQRKQAEEQRKKQMERLLQKQTQDLSELYKQSGNSVPDNIKELLQQLMGQSDGEGSPGDDGGNPAEVEAAFEQASKEAVKKTESPLEELLRRLGEAIRYLDKGDGPRDVVSNATFKYGGRMIKAGIPVDAIMHAFALTWPQHSREELEIATYDVATFRNGTEPLDNQHYAVPYVEAMVNAGIPVMLVGPTQAGKGYLTKNIAENRKVQYGSVPLSAGTSISWLFGRNMPKGFVSTDLIRCYQDGGVFLFDEMDAADSNLLLGVNDALSNNELSNPVVDERIVKHPDFIPLAAANTWGLGADADYTGRERLDMATLERWRIGRVEIQYDRNLQKRIAEDESEELLRVKEAE